MTLVLTPEELACLTGYKQPARQAGQVAQDQRIQVAALISIKSTTCERFCYKLALTLSKILFLT